MMFDTAIEVLYNAIKGVNGISEYLKAEDMFNKLERDYKHCYENAKTQEKINFWGQAYKCLLDKRREIKVVISEYESGGFIFERMSKDKAFMEEFEQVYEVFKKIHEMNEKELYRQESDSQLVKNEDFCVGKKSETNRFGLSKYNVHIKSVNPKQESFSRCVYAKDEKGAIQEVLDFIKAINYKIPFKNPEGITVIKITDDFEDSKEYL